MAGNPWFILRGKRRFGPFTTDKLRELAGKGKLNPTDLLYRDGMESPRRLAELKELFSLPQPQESSPETKPPELSAVAQSTHKSRSVPWWNHPSMIGALVAVVLVVAAVQEYITVGQLFSSATTPDLADFADNTYRYKGQLLKLTLHWDSHSRLTLRDFIRSTDAFPQELPFTQLRFSSVHPHVIVDVDVSSNLASDIPNIRDLELATITFRCDVAGHFKCSQWRAKLLAAEC